MKHDLHRIAVPEQVYADAARTYACLVSSRSNHAAEVTRRSAADPAFRAAVESAYRAGQAAMLTQGAEVKYGIQWTEPDGQIFVSAKSSWRDALDEVEANAGHPELLDLHVVQSWRTPWVPSRFSDATPVRDQDGS